MITRLSANSIKFVKRLELDGITYCWYVAMKSGHVSDSRVYIYYDERETTCAKPYPKEQLPKAVQKFIDSHNEQKKITSANTS